MQTRIVQYVAQLFHADLDDDAVRVAFGRNVLLKEDCLAAIQAKPELAGRSFIRVLEKLA